MVSLSCTRLVTCQEVFPRQEGGAWFHLPRGGWVFEGVWRPWRGDERLLAMQQQPPSCGPRLTSTVKTEDHGFRHEGLPSMRHEHMTQNKIHM